jgi:CheY-like chemotaxis protein
MIRTILAVDNDELVRTALTRALTEANFEVTSASNGKEGLDKALAEHPDMIICDLIMPEMGGHEMLDKLREDEWGKKARAIILSADESTDSLNQSLEEGVTVYFSKNNTSLESLVKQISALS